ncbi:unnamed protein product [Closterium sp. Naga37s-1]|nr:unnamed protein product [Closterium sp. Naga37s-1]
MDLIRSVRCTDRWRVPVRCAGRRPRWRSRTRRSSPRAARTSACSTTAASSPPWWDSARSAALTRLRSKCCDAVCFRTLAPWHSTSKLQSMHIPVITMVNLWLAPPPSDRSSFTLPNLSAPLRLVC